MFLFVALDLWRLVVGGIGTFFFASRLFGAVTKAREIDVLQISV